MSQNNKRNVAPKTFEEHREYLYEIVRLKINFLWRWLQSHPEESFRRALQNSVDIYRKTDINSGFANHKTRDFDDPRWRALEDSLEALYRQRRNDCGPDRFEAEAFDIVRPQIDLRAPRDFKEPPEAIAFKYRFGSLDYDPPASRHPQRVFLHIANALTPRSFFDEPEYLADCFQRMIDSARRDDATEIETTSWLNSHDRWLTWFPPAWQMNMSPPICAVDAGFGIWGQFLTARGTFNSKNGRRLRATGQFPFMPRHSWCKLLELEFHQKKLHIGVAFPGPA